MGSGDGVAVGAFVDVGSGVGVVVGGCIDWDSRVGTNAPEVGTGESVGVTAGGEVSAGTDMLFGASVIVGDDVSSHADRIARDSKLISPISPICLINRITSPTHPSGGCSV